MIHINLIYSLQDFGLKSHEIALNALSIGKSTKDFFPEDPDLPPLVHAEAFADPNNEKAEAPEYLLQQARLLISTELGKDPLLRREIRARFKEDATVTITPTEKGLNKIDEHHPYHVGCLLSFDNLMLTYFV